MTLTHKISRAELSSDPSVGKVLGDGDPSTDQDGAVTKLAKSDEEIKTDLEDLADIFDDHDHDPDNPTGGGGQPLGTDGVRSIAAGAIIEEKIGALQVTGGKTQASAITSSKIADATVERAQLGAPRSASQTIASGGSWTWTHGLGYRPLFHVEIEASVGPIAGFDGENLAFHSAGANSVTFENNGVAPMTITVRYFGG